jgi:hypothetical protein
MTYVSHANAATEAKAPGTVVKVKKEESTKVVEANLDRISVTLTNDSENTIYVFKGKGAKVGEGIRLNAEGGSIVIDDYTGEITAAAKSAESNLGVCEV